MKRLALLFGAVAVVLAVAASALAATNLAGKYKEVIKNDSALGGALNGTWVLKLTKSDKYSASLNGKLTDKGKATISGNKITFKDTGGPGKCPAPGKYKFKLTGAKLKLTAISDSTAACVGRKDVLTHGALTKS